MNSGGANLEPHTVCQEEGACQVGGVGDEDIRGTPRQLLVW